MLRILPVLLLTLGACRGGDDTPAPVESGATGDTAVSLVGEPPLQFRGTPPRNILIVSIDTLRVDHLSRYSELDLMPWLDEQMSTGVVFDDHRTCSNWTYMAVPCTLLGTLHEDRSFIPRFEIATRVPFPDDTPFLATHLQDAGWRTGVVSANSWFSASWNTVQGYGDGTTKASLTDAKTLLRQARGTVQAWEDEGDAPWLMHVHVMEPHAPYNPPIEYLDGLEGLDPIRYDLSFGLGHYQVVEVFDTLDPEEQEDLEAHLRARYQAELRYLDDSLRDALAVWEERGLLDDTLLVFWNDHGESLLEHGEIGHAWDLHAEENDGMLVLKAPTLVPAAWEGPTHAIDLAPTLLQLAGLDIPDEMSGLPLGTAPADRARFALTLGRGGGQSAVEQDGMKLVFEWSEGTPQLFDRRTDPMEQVDLYSPTHPAVAALWAELRPHVERAAALAPEQTLVWPTDLP